MNSVVKNMLHELREHAPFTLVGTLVGVAFMALVVYARVPESISRGMFWVSHPAHVLLSAITTASMYRLHGKRRLLATFLIGYTGSVGIATLSDCIIPYIGEWLIGLPNKGIHLGFIEEWAIVNPIALLGVAIACVWPRTKIPHAGHVLLSMWASLFHMMMAVGNEFTALTAVLVPVFLFLAVWLPCCTSDIVFPMMFAKQRPALAAEGGV